MFRAAQQTLPLGVRRGTFGFGFFLFCPPPLFSPISPIPPLPKRAQSRPATRARNGFARAAGRDFPCRPHRAYAARSAPAATDRFRAHKRDRASRFLPPVSLPILRESSASRSLPAGRTARAHRSPKVHTAAARFRVSVRRRAARVER